MTKSSIESPCIGVCTLDTSDICLGCGRSLAEIARWRELTIIEQRKVIAIARQRLSAKAAANNGKGV